MGYKTARLCGRGNLLPVLLVSLFVPGICPHWSIALDRSQGGNALSSKQHDFFHHTVLRQPEACLTRRPFPKVGEAVEFQRTILFIENVLID